MRLLTACVMLSFVLAAVGCGSTQSASEYAAELDVMANRVDAELDAESQAFFAQPAGLEDTVAFLDSRVSRYAGAVDEFDMLRPPPELEAVHDAIMDLLNAILAAERERAAFAATIDLVDDLHLIWEGAATEAVLAAEAKSVALCHTIQAEFDETEQRGELSDAPWVPGELKDTVSTVMNCPDA